MAVFSPNLTSRLIVKVAAKKCRIADFRFLEIGCGSGFITKELLLDGRLDGESCWLSDVSAEAIASAQRNLQGLVHPERIKIGSCLTPWSDLRFDLIVSDVSGISEEIAQASDWYLNVPSNCGLDGLTNTLEVLHTAAALLRELGSLVFPVISLSDVTRLESEMASEFGQVEIFEETKWPLPLNLAMNTSLLERLCDEGKISIERKYGRIIAKTSVAVCSRPIKS